MIRSALLVLVSVTLCSAACGVGWKEFEEKCYKQFAETLPINQIDAKESCVNEGGNLASITTAEENTFINEQMTEDLGYSWIGIEFSYDATTSTGTATWTDGSPFAFEDWWFYGPGDSAELRCGQLNRKGLPEEEWGWYTAPCNESSANSYICEMEFKTTEIPTTVPITTTTTRAPTTKRAGRCAARWPETTTRRN